MVGLNRSSFVHVLVPGPVPTNAYGEVLEILQVNQDFQKVGYPLWFAQVRWFKVWSGNVNTCGMSCESWFYYCPHIHFDYP